VLDRLGELFLGESGRNLVIEVSDISVENDELRSDREKSVREPRTPFEGRFTHALIVKLLGDYVEQVLDTVRSVARRSEKKRGRGFNLVSWSGKEREEKRRELLRVVVIRGPTSWCAKRSSVSGTS
jgi:hypothetical protein